MRFVGIDISKRQFHAALLHEGKVEKKSPNNNEAGIKDFLGWLAKHAEGPVHVCMEATGTYWEALARALSAAGHTVSVENPKFIHNFAKALNLRTKTDEVDAVLIARYVETIRPLPWHPPSDAQYELKQLLRRRGELVKMLTQENNRLQAGCLHIQEKASLERLIVCIKNEIATLERQIRKHQGNDPELAEQEKLLRTLPGVGEMTSWTLLASLRPITAYASAKQVAAFAGLTPKERSSGTSVRGKAHMCKIGDGQIRKMLYMAAMGAMRRDPAVQAFTRRLAEKKKPTKLIQGAVMRKLLHAAYGVLKHRLPYDPALAFPLDCA